MRVTHISRRLAKSIKHPPANAAIISIYTPGDRPCWLSPEWAAVHKSCFFDSEAWEKPPVILGKENSYRDFYPCISIPQAERIYSFIIFWVDRGIETFMVHCDAGISRSAAIALFIAEKYGDPTFNMEYAVYNRTVYRMLKEVEHGRTENE